MKVKASATLCTNGLLKYTRMKEEIISVRKDGCAGRYQNCYFPSFLFRNNDIQRRLPDRFYLP
jgi:hypothetical protein